MFRWYCDHLHQARNVSMILWSPSSGKKHFEILWSPSSGKKSFLAWCRWSQYHRNIAIKDSKGFLSMQCMSEYWAVETFVTWRQGYELRAHFGNPSQLIHLPHKLDKLVTNYKCKGRLHCLPTHLSSFYVWWIGRVSDMNSHPLHWTSLPRWRATTGHTCSTQHSICKNLWSHYSVMTHYNVIYDYMWNCSIDMWFWQDLGVKKFIV